MTKKGIQRDMMFYMPAKVLEGLIGIVAISVYSKLLSPAEYGKYGLINPLILITFTLISGWVYHSAYRFSNDPHFENKTLMSTLAVMLLMTQGVAFGVLVACKLYFQYDISSWMLILFYFAYSTFQVLNGILVSRRFVISASLISMGAVTIKLIAMVCLFYLGVQNYLAILLGNFIADTLLALLVAWRLRLTLSLKNVSFTPIKTFMAYGYPLIGLSFTMMIMSVSDRYVIKYFYSSAEVGIYTANYSVASAAFTLLTVGLMRAVYPNILAQFQKGDMPSTENLLYQSMRLYMLIAVPAAFGLWMISQAVSSFVLDAAYTEGALIIGYVAFGMVFLGLSEYASKPFELMKQTKTIFYISVAGAILNIILNFLFVPVYGYVVAALTTAAAYAFHGTMMFYFGSKRIPLRLDHKATLSVLISSVAMTLCGFWMLGRVSGKLSLIFVIFLSALVYFAGIWISGTYKNEMKLFKDLLGGRKHAS
jgi:O-antigen/teichoic acid export membrane protein